MSRTNSIALMLMTGCWIAAGQSKASKSVRDGVYSSEQVARGEAAYREHCASCHGPELAGKGQNPPLAGSAFLMNWEGRDLGELFEKMQDTMPADRPGELAKAVNASILAYVLKMNHFPPGTAELPANADALKGITFPTEK
jgi:mono/diheme cytochrome c family protein